MDRALPARIFASCEARDPAAASAAEEGTDYESHFRPAKHHLQCGLMMGSRAFGPLAPGQHDGARQRHSRPAQHQALFQKRSDLVPRCSNRELAALCQAPQPQRAYVVLNQNSLTYNPQTGPGRCQVIPLSSHERSVCTAEPRP